MNDNTQRGNPVLKTYETKVGAMLLKTKFDSFQHILKKILDAYSILRERWHFSGREISQKPVDFYTGTELIYYIKTIKSFFFDRSDVSRHVALGLDSKPVSVLCHMGDIGCGD